MSNNPEKMLALEEMGLEVVERVSLVISAKRGGQGLSAIPKKKKWAICWSWCEMGQPVNKGILVKDVPEWLPLCSLKEGTGVNTRGGQVLTRYQHPWFQSKVRRLLLGQADGLREFRRPHA